MEDTLYTALSAIARTYPLSLPEKQTTYPAIVYKRISTAPQRTHNKDGKDKARFQIDIYGTTYDAVNTAANSVVTTLEAGAGFSFLPTKENRFDVKEVKPDLFRTVLEFFVWN